MKIKLAALPGINGVLCSTETSSSDALVHFAAISLVNDLISANLLSSVNLCFLMIVKLIMQYLYAFIVHQGVMMFAIINVKCIYLINASI